MVAKSKKKAPKVKKTKETKASKPEEDILKAIDAISDESDDEDAGQIIRDAGEEEEWDKEALALRQMISDGKFNELLKRHDEKKDDASSDDEVAEEELDEEEDDDASKDDSEEEVDANGDENDSESSDDEEDHHKPNVQDTRATALRAAILSSNRNLPFAESFTVVPPTPLPFGPPASSSSIAVGVDEEDEAVDVHDDLKREVAFYDTALEAVNLARGECERVGIPFTRPEDFFAEMIKTDGKFLFLMNIY
jgi:rRNA-processing protein EBP2